MASKGKKVLKVILIILGSLILLVGIILAVYAYNNLHYDEKDMKKMWKAGYTEKQVTLANGTLLNYGESPDENNEKTPLLLIHGQAMAWEDYARVLPKLAETYHVYAIDCHGHGDSSHDASRYNCQLMTDDFVAFINEVIKQPCVVSGHSSGGILAANVAATSPENVIGAVLEDPPFFSVLPEEMENTFVLKDSFEVNHAFCSSRKNSILCPTILNTETIYSHAIQEAQNRNAEAIGSVMFHTRRQLRPDNIKENGDDKKAI